MNAAPRSQAAFNKPSVATEADVVLVESNFSEGTRLTVAAADYTSASSSVKKLDGLGMQEQAADAPYIDYNLPLKAGTNTITLRFLPTFSIATAAASSTWNQNVLRGWSTGKSHEYVATE